MTGRVVLMGSGELAPRMVRVHREGIERAGAEKVTVLDTPYGFQENADLLTQKIVDFFRTSLVIDVEVASLRSRDATEMESARFLSTVHSADYVFAGPGSPSYALQVWKGVGLRDALIDVVARGGTATFASAAALTIGRSTIPVYEIYKVGLEPSWLDGLDVLGAFGVGCAVVPHWNNAEGGSHDTSRCYIGERRLQMLLAQRAVGIVGIDEHTAATLDFGTGDLAVAGIGAATLRAGSTRSIRSGERISIASAQEILGTIDIIDVVDIVDAPHATGEAAQPGILPDVADGDRLLAELLEAETASHADPQRRSRFRSLLVDLVDRIEAASRDPRDHIGPFVDLLLDLRESNRIAGRFDVADLIRDRLLRLGIEVRDGRDGPDWHLESGRRGARRSSEVGPPRAD